MISSPGWQIARSDASSASDAPTVTTISVSGSYDSPSRASRSEAISWRSSIIPLLAE